MTNSTDLELSGLSSDTAFGVTIKYDFKLNDNLDSAFQCALLYTSVTGQRRIRIHTLTVSSTSLLGDVFKYSELDTTLNYLVKQCNNNYFFYIELYWFLLIISIYLLLIKQIYIYIFFKF